MLLIYFIIIFNKRKMVMQRGQKASLDGLDLLSTLLGVHLWSLPWSVIYYFGDQWRKWQVCNVENPSNKIDLMLAVNSYSLSSQYLLRAVYGAGIFTTWMHASEYAQFLTSGCSQLEKDVPWKHQHGTAERLCLIRCGRRPRCSLSREGGKTPNFAWDRGRLPGGGVAWANF